MSTLYVAEVALWRLPPQILPMQMPTSCPIYSRIMKTVKVKSLFELTGFPCAFFLPWLFRRLLTVPNAFEEHIFFSLSPRVRCYLLPLHFYLSLRVSLFSHTSQGGLPRNNMSSGGVTSVLQLQGCSIWVPQPTVTYIIPV